MSHQQLRSYADRAIAYSLIRQTGGVRDPIRDPWVQGKWFSHYTAVAHQRNYDLEQDNIFFCLVLGQPTPQ